MCNNLNDVSFELSVTVLKRNVNNLNSEKKEN